MYSLHCFGDTQNTQLLFKGFFLEICYLLFQYFRQLGVGKTVVMSRIFFIVLHWADYSKRPHTVAISQALFVVCFMYCNDTNTGETSTILVFHCKLFNISQQFPWVISLHKSHM